MKPARLFVGGLVLAAGLSLAAFWFWPRPRFNVLIVTLDTTRADHLGCYGHASAETPTLDSLAAKGVLFEKAYATVAMTLPSHATIFTGLNPPEHGLHVNGKGRLGTQIPTLAEVLSKRGYDTGAFVASFILHSKFGLDRGFQTYDDEMAGGERHGSETHLMRNGKQVVDAALAWLTRRSGRPFFCWVHLYDPHVPYDAHEESFGNRFRDSPYDGDIAYADQQIGRLLDFLKERGLDQRTVIVVVGDHGEGLGEHEEREHGFLVYNSTIHVPLIVAGPSIRKGGRRISSAVSLVDVFPTVLDSMRLSSGKQVSGRSLHAALRGAAIEPRPCFSEADTAFDAYGWAPQQSIATDAWKYIRTPREELYDLRTDPHELNNLAASQPETLAELQRLLADMTAGMIEPPHANVPLTDLDRRKLESLGYATGGKGDFVPSGEPLPDVKDMIGYYNTELDARELLEAGKLAEAESVLRGVIQAAPEFMTARTTLGRVLQKQKRLEEAIAVYEDALRVKPNNAEAHFDLANVLAGRGQLDAAIEHYSAALETDRLNHMAHLNLAGIYAFRGETELAREHYEAGLEEFPDSSSGQFTYGVFLAKQGEYEEALPHVERAVQLQPENAQMRYHLGFVLLALGRFDEAQAELEETIRLDPQYPGVQVQLQHAKSRQPRGK